MSSLDYTYENLDKVVPRSNFLAPTIDPKKTMLLVLDMQKACAEVGGAMYIESVGWRPGGQGCRRARQERAGRLPRQGHPGGLVPVGPATRWRGRGIRRRQVGPDGPAEGMAGVVGQRWR